MENKELKKKVSILTYGCQMNEYDSELIRSILRKAGYTLTSDELEADVILLNTCAIREHAQRRVYGSIHEIRHRRKEATRSDIWPDGRDMPLFGILGCMATSLRQELLEDRNLNIDLIAGPDSYKRLPELIAACAPGSTAKPFDLTLSEFETYSDVYPSREHGVNAWIAVMRGCNNFCSFCVVPYTRGRERSRSVQNVVEEARRLADEGFQQVTLLGQNVNSYSHDGLDFADLMTAVSQIEGIRRIRFTSPHPKDFPDKLLRVMAETPKICRQIHLPLQSGNDLVLERMNRTYTRNDFLTLVDNIRGRLPNVALSTDVIVGFSGESETEFDETLDVMRKVEFDLAFTFKYSERKNTIASRKYPDDVPENAKTERIVRLVDLQREISLRKNQSHVGETHLALVEKSKAAKSPDHCVGRLDNNKVVVIDKAPGTPVGTWLNVQIDRATPNDLKGFAIFP